MAIWDGDTLPWYIGVDTTGRSYKFGGMDFTFGREYGETTDPWYPGGPNMCAFVFNGIGFNMLRFIQSVEGDNMPTGSKDYLFTDDGEYIDSGTIKFAIYVRYDSGRAFILGFPYTVNDTVLATNISTIKTTLGYNGCDFNNITEDDYKAFTLYIYQNTVEDDVTQRSPMGGWVKMVQPGQYYDFNSPANSSRLDGPLNNIGKYVEADGGWEPNNNSPLYYSSNPWMEGWTPPAFMFTELTQFTEDTAESGGGYGDYGFYSDSVGFSDLPTVGFEDTGFCTMYAPTLLQVKSLASYMWTDDFIDNLKKLITDDPIKSIINFGLVPIDLTLVRGNTQSVIIGNVNTGVSMNHLDSQYISVNMGTVKVPERWGSALDYEPYTIIECFCPFCGVVQLPTSEVMGGEIGLQYNVNLFSGDFVAELYLKNKRTENVLFHHTGQMFYNCPLTAGDYTSFYKNILGAAPRIIAAAASGNPAQAAGSVITTAMSAALTPMQVQRSGTVTGGNGVMGCFTPYIIIRQPVQHLSKKYGKLEGYPSYLDRQLKNLKGYVEIESIKLDGFTGTEEEGAELERILKGGVYF